jgi:hypothetical protein
MPARMLPLAGEQRVLLRASHDQAGDDVDYFHVADRLRRDFNPPPADNQLKFDKRGIRGTELR